MSTSLSDNDEEVEEEEEGEEYEEEENGGLAPGRIRPGTESEATACS
jgi:hypothetical protein